MSAIKDGRVSIMLDKERHLLFSLNVLDAIQERYESVEILEDLLNDPKHRFKNLRWLLTLMINDGADDGEPELTEKQVGKLVTPDRFSELAKAVLDAFAIGSRGTAKADQEEPEEEPEEDEKNGEAGE